MDNFNMGNQLSRSEEDIKKAEGKKKTATILMIVSIFCLWPLLVVGIIMYISANNNINQLNEEKQKIMFMKYKNENMFD